MLDAGIANATRNILKLFCPESIIHVWNMRIYYFSHQQFFLLLFEIWPKWISLWRPSGVWDLDMGNSLSIPLSFSLQYSPSASPAHSPQPLSPATPYLTELINRSPVIHTLAALGSCYLPSILYGMPLSIIRAASLIIRAAPLYYKGYPSLLCRLPLYTIGTTSL